VVSGSAVVDSGSGVVVTGASVTVVSGAGVVVGRTDSVVAGAEGEEAGTGPGPLERVGAVVVLSGLGVVGSTLGGKVVKTIPPGDVLHPDKSATKPNISAFIIILRIHKI